MPHAVIPVLVASLLALTACASLDRVAAAIDKASTSVDSVPATARRAAEEVLPRLEFTIDSALASTEQTTARIHEQMLEAADSVDLIVSRRLMMLETNANRAFVQFLEELRYRGTYEFQPFLASVSGTAVDAATDRLAAALEGALLGALGTAADTISGRAVRSAGARAREEVEKNSVLPIVGGVIGGLVLLGLFYALFRADRARRAEHQRYHEREQMLLAVTQAIHDHNDPAVLNDIKRYAEAGNLNTQLKEWLRERNRLRSLG